MKTRGDTGADVRVLLTPRELGGHETALFGWLADAVRQLSLEPEIHAGGAAVRQAAAAAGLASYLHPANTGSLAGLLRATLSWPADKPLLLAPGVLHAQAWLLLAALLLGRRVWVYVPMTYTAEAMGFRVGRWRDRLLRPWLRHVDTWVTLDARQAAQLHGHWGVAAGRVLTLPNPLRRVREGLPWPVPTTDGRLRVAYVGRFEPHQKGLDWLIELLRQPLAWTAHCQWRFQGSGAAEAALERLAVEFGAGNRVLVQRPAPIRLALAHADVLLLASRFEGAPLVALEATALGWPVVATRSSGVEAFVPEQSLFDFGDADGLRRALHGLASVAARQQAVAHQRAALQAMGLRAAYWRSLAEVCWAIRLPRQCAASGLAARRVAQ